MVEITADDISLMVERFSLDIESTSRELVKYGIELLSDIQELYDYVKE